MLIKNFGHFWERKFINYGRGKNPGHLWGYNGTKESNFREQIGVYVLYDRDFEPIYVGQTGTGDRRLLARLNDHETDHLWNRWDLFSWFGFHRVNIGGELANPGIRQNFNLTPSTLLNQFEAILIQALEPTLNKQGAKWKDCTEYFQYIDEEVKEITNFQIISEIKDLKKSLSKKKN